MLLGPPGVLINYKGRSIIHSPRYQPNTLNAYIKTTFPTGTLPETAPMPWNLTRLAFPGVKTRSPPDSLRYLDRTSGEGRIEYVTLMYAPPPPPPTLLYRTPYSPTP